jgi:hypothetical protein
LGNGAYVDLSSADPKFFCLRCLKKMDKEEAQKRDKLSALVEEIRKEQQSKTDRVNET